MIGTVQYNSLTSVGEKEMMRSMLWFFHEYRDGPALTDLVIALQSSYCTVPPRSDTPIIHNTIHQDQKSSLFDLATAYNQQFEHIIFKSVSSIASYRPLRKVDIAAFSCVILSSSLYA